MELFNLLYRCFFNLLESINIAPINLISKNFNDFAIDLRKVDFIIKTEFIFWGDFFKDNFQFNQTEYFYHSEIFSSSLALKWNKDLNSELFKKNFLSLDSKVLDDNLFSLLNINKNSEKIFLMSLKVNEIQEGFFLFQLKKIDPAIELFFSSLVSNVSSLLSSLITYKAREEYKKENELKFKYIFENVSDGIVLIREDFTIVESNTSFDSKFVESSLPTINKNINNFIKNSSYEKFRKATTYCFETFKDVSFELFLTNINGKEIKVNAHLFPFKNKKKKKQLLIIFNDLTTIQEYENKILIEKNRAEASEKIKTNFLILLSHEIRTPLSNILNYLSLIKSEIELQKDEEFKNYFESIENNSRRIIRTIELIVNLSSIISGTYKADIKKFNLIKKIVEPLKKKYENLAASANLTFIVDYPSNDIKVKADESSIFYILDQFVDNAIKFTKEGYVKFSISETAENVIVQVEDTGIGISKEHIKKIFEPFSQETEGYTRTFDGCGVSLCSAKKLAELNNIQLTIESEKGKGTIAKLIFPKRNDEFAFLAEINI